jgi:RNA polymerase sigma-70 factor (ECF subfamily)
MSADARSIALSSAVRIGVFDFERCVAETQRVVFAIAFAVLGNRDDAQDVTQDVFMTAFHKRSHLRDPERFRAWVARTSYRLALNRRRGQQRAQARDEAAALDHPTGVADDPYCLVAARMDDRRLRAAIDRLPDKLRAVVLLCAVDGLGSRTVGAALHIPEGTVRSRLHLGRKQLLRMLYS